MPYFWIICLLILSACSHQSVPPEDSKKNGLWLERFTIQHPPRLGKSSAAQEVFLGGLSGLFYAGKNKEGDPLFWAPTDRGPNAEPTTVPGKREELRPFLLPNFQPRLVLLRPDLKTKVLHIQEQKMLFRKNATAMTGLPNRELEDEIPIDVFGEELTLDPWGADFESLVMVEDGSFWLGDEYRPSLWHFTAEGKLLERFSAGTELPKVYTRRRKNRGFEAIAYQEGKLYAFLQSPIEKKSQNIRVLEFDTKKKVVTGEYFYSIESNKSDKIGDALALAPAQLLVLERDDAVGLDSFKKIFRVSFAGATNLQQLSRSFLQAHPDIDSWSLEELQQNGIQPVKKEFFIDLATNGFDYAAKAEGLAKIDDQTIAIINDNDFGIEGIPSLRNGWVPMKPENTTLLILHFPRKLLEWNHK